MMLRVITETLAREDMITTVIIEVQEKEDMIAKAIIEALVRVAMMAMAIIVRMVGIVIRLEIVEEASEVYLDLENIVVKTINILKN